MKPCMTLNWIIFKFFIIKSFISVELFPTSTESHFEINIFLISLLGNSSLFWFHFISNEINISHPNDSTDIKQMLLSLKYDKFIILEYISKKQTFNAHLIVLNISKLSVLRLSNGWQAASEILNARSPCIAVDE